MKKLVIAILCGLFLFVSCSNDKVEKAPKELKAIATYVYNGQVYNQFSGFYGLYKDFSQPSTEGNKQYDGLQKQLIMYTDQWIGLLQAKDAEIEALEAENKALREFIDVMKSVK
jgi:hypothetical protein